MEKMKTPRQLIRDHFAGKLEHCEERMEGYDYFEEIFKYPFMPDISDIEELIQKAQDEAIEETVKACSEYSNYKESIFEIGEQLKSKPINKL